MKLFLHRSVLFFLLLTGSSALAQIRFTASISPSPVGKNDLAQLDLTLENANGNVKIFPPSLKNFTIVNGPFPSTSTVNVNGVSTTGYTYTFVLKPKAIGNFVIPAALATVDGKELHSNPVAIKVTSQSQAANSNQPQNPFSLFGQPDPFEVKQEEIPYDEYIIHKGENVQEKVKKSMFIKVELSKNSCYVGEPVVATYKLYTRLKSESNFTENPSFNGFSVIDLQQPDISNYVLEKLNGKQYCVYTLRKAQLYPLQPGKLEIESAEVENNIRFIKAEYLQSHGTRPEDAYRNFTEGNMPAEATDDEKVAIKSDKLAVDVKGLPEEKKPTSFKGAVGVFEIKSALQKNNFTTDDAGLLRIAIAGEGNMQLITAPDMSWPAGIEAFDNKATDDLVKTNVPVAGTKYFDYPFSVNKPGTYIIHPVEFSFFDISSNRYKTIRTDSLSFVVVEGNGRPSDSIMVTQPGKEKFFNHLFSNRWMVIAPVILLVFVGLFFWLRNENKKDDALKEIVVRKQAEEERHKIAETALLADQFDPLESVKDCLERSDTANFYSNLNSCLRKFLAKKLDIPFEELSKKQIMEKMDKKGFSNEVALQLQQLMDEIEWQLYSNASEEHKMQDIYERTDELIQRFRLN